MSVKGIEESRHGGLPFAEDGVRFSCLYPKEEPVISTAEKEVLKVTFEKPMMARLFMVEG